MSALAILCPDNMQDKARGELGAEDDQEDREVVEVEEGGDKTPGTVNNPLILEAGTVDCAELCEVEAPVDREQEHHKT